VILLLVDVQNLFYSMRDTFGQGSRIDFKKLMELARNNRDMPVQAIAYLARYRNQESAPIAQALTTLGYSLRYKEAKTRDGQSKGTDIDSALILDAMDITTDPLQGCEVVVVASGDSDFIPLYQTLQKRGIRVEVIAFQDSLSKHSDIVNCADDIRILSHTIMFGEGDSAHAGPTEEGAPRRRSNTREH
jgi:uncharacterized LabA/DUF88 family protein